MNKEDYYIEILNIWKSTFDDIRCNAIIYYQDKAVANIIECFHIDKGTPSLIEQFILGNIDKYIGLPKISECNKLLKEAYDTVCESDNEMFYITDDEWQELVRDGEYNKDDFNVLQEEIKKYELEDLVTINNDDGEKIVGYGDLSTKFNDDRKLLEINNEKDKSSNYKRNYNKDRREER